MSFVESTSGDGSTETSKGKPFGDPERRDDMSDLLNMRSRVKMQAYRRWASQDLAAEITYSVVVPTYNEEWRIVPTIGAIANHMSSLGRPWELIVSDDGSTDTTVELVQNLKLAGLRLLIADHNRGKGGAVRRGVFEARGDVILFADADQSTPIEQFELLNDLIGEGHQVVVASRAAAGSDVANKSALRDLMSAGLRRLVKLQLGLSVTDSQCGFKLFTREAACDLFGRQTLEGFSFDLEILYLATKYGYGIAEIPIQWFDAPGSKVDSFKVARRFLADMAEIRRIDAAGGYDQPLPEPWAQRRDFGWTPSEMAGGSNPTA